MEAVTGLAGCGTVCIIERQETGDWWLLDHNDTNHLSPLSSVITRHHLVLPGTREQYSHTGLDLNYYGFLKLTFTIMKHVEANVSDWNCI